MLNVFGWLIVRMRRRWFSNLRNMLFVVAGLGSNRKSDNSKLAFNVLKSDFPFPCRIIPLLNLRVDSTGNLGLNM